MLYYRFRPTSEVSFKELLYSEMYFSSGEECNDPLDGETFYEFPPDPDLWEKLLTVSLGKLHEFYPKAALATAQLIADQGSLTFREAASINIAELFRSTLGAPDPPVLDLAVQGFNRLLNLYQPPPNYFVSFSRECDNFLLWSHYASKHEGFCLVFRSINGALRQDPESKRTSIRRITPNSFSPAMSNSVPEEFQFHKIRYESDITHLNAFYLFPKSIAPELSSEAKRKNLARRHDDQYSIKHSSWSYEKESRITLRGPISWLFGDRFEYTSQERLFHYEPPQLVGVIFGARMSEDNKSRLFQVLDERSERIARRIVDGRITFDFLVQQASVSARAGTVQISPLGFHGRINRSRPGDEKFESTLDRWRKGGGIKYDGKSTSNVVVPD